MLVWLSQFVDLWSCGLRRMEALENFGRVSVAVYPTLTLGLLES